MSLLIGKCRTSGSRILLELWKNFQTSYTTKKEVVVVPNFEILALKSIFSLILRKY